MIIRILTEGQFDVPESEVDGLNVLDEKLEAGLQLLGSEVKALREGTANLADAYALAAPRAVEERGGRAARCRRLARPRRGS